ncbi:hypothetical protein JQ629_28175 [Bradyrhizobium sp. AUGA SZCCT0222]|uniref:hypothetical protein n=1 Tax=Bradyrhizobium sp. AUGA SZCCT0222 TaxID=2807668 RepID=UPI001BA6113D|nr:hypothetical protein [Bradyrhizobium sp. AUGA SZCCT0222]MBR1271367.1 hypothetical protein [Bradyrhizobium sp. AUGA SZCCT0222]
MAKKAKKASPNKKKKAKKKQTHKAKLLAHPATAEMIARVNGCNKPPILWRKQSDGSWLECFLKPDCTYGNCQVVLPSQVPLAIRNK